MPAITRWDPFNDFVGLREAMDRLMNDAFVRPARFITDRADAQAAPEFGMPVDVTETADAITVKATLPGVKADDVDINITGDVLTIRGEMKSETEKDEGNVHRKEIRYGNYSRSFTLPTAVQSDGADATFENGILTLRLPKMDEVKPKQIKVQAKAPAIETQSQPATNGS